MELQKKTNNLLGWAVFIVSLIVYLLTLEPTVSFWDCGEFIAAAHKLQVPHPPGAPFFLLVQRVFSLAAPSNAHVALFMNAFSAIASAATIMFLYWTIVRLVLRFKSNKEIPETVLYGSAIIGALAFAFTDTFWFSAVEAEVYALSSLFTAVVFWAILRWEAECGQKHANRWILFIAYLMGLSIGVHLLNLLAIPAIALIAYFKKYNPASKGVLATLIASGATILFIMYGIVQGIPALARKFEVLFVNSFNMPFNSGLLFFIVLLLGLLVVVVAISYQKNKPLLNLAAMSVLLICLGFSSYASIIIRSAANPPMDENNPENAYALVNYLNRSQYGQTPLVSGHYYNAPAVDVEKGKTEYYPGDEEYIKVESSAEYQFDRRFKTLFPRMYSSQSNHVHGYKMWGKIEGRKVTVGSETATIPTFGENIRFFVSYQLGYMYFRYFMWNFAGRQNDKQGHGDVLNGNWLSGIGFIDKARLGHNGTQPASLSNPETTNRYFMLPLLLGLLGAFFHYKKSRNDFWVLALLFFMTGIAIVLYLNQTPYQPRERDYAYIGSFYAFSIWIGIGVISLYSFFVKKLPAMPHVPALVLGLAVPALLLAQNYNDHNRSGRYFVSDTGKNYLNTCAPNAVLFTYGDNDTFPLWYAQDVEETRPDVRICNVTLLHSDWYINQMKQKTYDSEPLPITMASEKYVYNNRNAVLIRDDVEKAIELSRLIEFALNDNERAKLQTRGGDSYNYMPTRNFKITVNKQAVIESSTLPVSRFNEIADTIFISYKGNYVTKSDLAILDMLANNNWQRPLYFDLGVIQTMNIDLEPYLYNEGLAYRFLPIKKEKGMQSTNTAVLYENLMKKYQWGNIDNPDIHICINTRNTIEATDIKHNFYQLASALFIESEKEKTEKTIDKLYSILPPERYKTSLTDVANASIYYRLNKSEKADKLLKTIALQRINNIEFYLSLGKNYIDTYQRFIDQESSILKEILGLLDENKRVELSALIDQKLDAVLREY
ncbi:MAG: DUF2723 domain-containing protein [Prolixibacteraceae bacterium]|nr:DUF2723 domain-containing protein [Prolixibacteraceae bacterium]MBN2649728.1 DUF2723 domain-containing protein [Prolixibacteraceae bacterium]